MSDATAAAPEAAQDKQAPAAKGGKSTLPIVVAAVVLALGAGSGGMWFFMNKSHADATAADADASGRDGKADKGKKGKAGEPKAPAIYVEFTPPFVVNFNAKGVLRFLQVNIQVMTRDQSVAELIKRHDPKIRNDMLMLLGSQTYETISTVQGKEELRKKALETIAKAIDDEGGPGKKVEELYFTGFVMQ